MQAGFIVPGLVPYARASETVAVVGPVLALAGAGVTVLLCRHGRTSVTAFVVAGAAAAWVSGGLALSTHEMLHRASGTLADRAALGLGALLKGAIGAGILSVPAGVVFGLLVASLARCLGVRRPRWFDGRPELQRAAVACILIAQLAVAVALACSMRTWQEGRF
jgi:hypothetical protein